MLKFFKKKLIEIQSPMDGEIIKIENVPDLVFSKKMLGDGFAIIPVSGDVKAPVDGKIVQIFPTNHAFGIAMENGLEMLVHIGIDTVELKGKGFSRMIEPGSFVKAGDVIIKVDLDLLKSMDKVTLTPIIFTKGENIKKISVNFGSALDKPAAIVELI